MIEQVQYDFDFLQSQSALERRFHEFHEANPHVYRELVTLALQLRQKGHGAYGIKSLFEVIRWHRALETTDQDFKLNNNHAPYYARAIMAAEPELRGFFNVRELKTERAKHDR